MMVADKCYLHKQAELHAVEAKNSAWFLEDVVLNVILRQTFMFQVFCVVSEMWNNVTLKHAKDIFLPFPLIN